MLAAAALERTVAAIVRARHRGAWRRRSARRASGRTRRCLCCLRRAKGVDGRDPAPRRPLSCSRRAGRARRRRSWTVARILRVPARSTCSRGAEGLMRRGRAVVVRGGADHGVRSAAAEPAGRRRAAVVREPRRPSRSPAPSRSMRRWARVVALAGALARWPSGSQTASSRAPDATGCCWSVCWTPPPSAPALDLALGPLQLPRARRCRKAVAPAGATRQDSSPARRACAPSPACCAASEPRPARRAGALELCLSVLCRRSLSTAGHAALGSPAMARGDLAEFHAVHRGRGDRGSARRFAKSARWTWQPGPDRGAHRSGDDAPAVERLERWEHQGEHAGAALRARHRPPARARCSLPTTAAPRSPSAPASLCTRAWPMPYQRARTPPPTARGCAAHAGPAHARALAARGALEPSEAAPAQAQGARSRARSCVRPAGRRLPACCPELPALDAGSGSRSRPRSRRGGRSARLAWLAPSRHRG